MMIAPQMAQRLKAEIEAPPLDDGGFRRIKELGNLHISNISFVGGKLLEQDAFVPVFSLSIWDTPRNIFHRH
jgi:hypothetical protein